MSTYRLKIKCNNAQLEVVAKSGALLAYELDRYLESFLNRKIESMPYAAPKKVYNQPQAQVQAQLPQQEVQVQIQPQQQEYTHQQQNPVYTQNTFNKEKAEEIEYIQHEAPAVQQQTIHEQYKQPQQEAYISLGDFLNSNKSADIFSEFIISAYYIKRILNINYFTIKMLNSKFYPATGSLVDLSILDEARTRGFIETKEEDGTLKYTLSSAGESYFINQLRG